MRLKQLEGLLGSLQQFQSPKIELEQYETGPHIAARMLYEIHSRFDDIEGCTVADFGCGCGTLGIGAAALGAGHVIGVDTDEDALELAAENCMQEEVLMDLVRARVPCIPLAERSVDVVVMNPPFGTRQKGADMAFLHCALQTARVAVYSLHKSSTRQHIERAAVQNYGAASAEVLYQVRYNLPASYGFHRKREVDIEVDLWRFVAG